MTKLSRRAPTAVRDESHSDSKSTPTNEETFPIAPISPHRRHKVQHSHEKMDLKQDEYEELDKEKDEGDEGIRKAVHVQNTPNVNDKNVMITIQTHTIEKYTSSPQRRFDHIRKKIPERSRYYVHFQIQIKLYGIVHDVHRTYADFKALHQILRKKYPRSTIPLHLPHLKHKRFDDLYIKGKIEDFNRYFYHLVQVTEIEQSRLLLRFCRDNNEENISDEDDDDTLSIMALLQSFPEQSVAIRNKCSYTLNIQVLRPGSVVAWQFKTRKFDIGFSTTFNNRPQSPYSRDNSNDEYVRGFYVCPEVGIFQLSWDNSYSWRRSKLLIYRAEALDSDLLSAASRLIFASDENEWTATSSASSHESKEEEEDILKNESLISSMTSITKSNHRSLLYRIPAPNPRQLVKSSLNLLRRKRDGTPGENTQSGYLLVQRMTKVRRRRWVRKWFELDVERGTLGYYAYPKTSGNTSRGPQQRLRLYRRHAALAIVGLTSAPTPFSLVVHVGRKRWELCAENALECEAWREAITTSIFLVQWNTRQRRFKTQSSDDRISKEEEEEDEDEEEQEELEGMEDLLHQDGLLGPPIAPFRKSTGFSIPKNTSSVESKGFYILGLNVLLLYIQMAPLYAVYGLLMIVNLRVLYVLWDYTRPKLFKQF